MDFGERNSEKGESEHDSRLGGECPVARQRRVCDFIGFWFAWFGRSYNGAREVLSATVDFTLFCLVEILVTGCSIATVGFYGNPPVEQHQQYITRHPETTTNLVQLLQAHYCATCPYLKTHDRTQPQHNLSNYDPARRPIKSFHGVSANFPLRSPAARVPRSICPRLEAQTSLSESASLEPRPPLMKSFHFHSI
ncbi:unnamed protein product [Sphenostylis stenocarpa]|uniref:Uncharacterized protein n=1 Tax=Sphenostylis stenocarpa TaxID=92480 RepID=A0AA86VGD5_9FABA|nr:unnamed protein product [Sphenostylis stenocarpa]